MPLTLEQYASWLDTRRLVWPPPPEIEPPRARAHLVAIPGLRAVVWNVYGTLIAINGGQLLCEHPQPFIVKNALERTIQEFKMWQSMSRKPGQPSEYLLEIYRQIILEQLTGSGGERFPEVDVARVWETILKRLMQKEYTFDAGFYGSLNEMSRKVAWHFHAAMQGYAAYEGAAKTLAAIHAGGLRQAIAADGQCFSAMQLQRALAAQTGGARLADWIADEAMTWSHDVRARTESERLLRRALEPILAEGIRADEVLYVTSRLPALATAKRLFLKTALFAGDKASLQATPEQLRESAHRPDILVTKLEQVAELTA